MTKSFAKVALTPKWIGALLAALALAAVFAGLSQWQLSRALTTVGSEPTNQTAVPLQDITKPGDPFKTKDKAKKVTIDLRLSAITNLGRVANRTQSGKNGYWQVALVNFSNSEKLVIAYDFSTQKTYLPYAPDGVIEGYYLPSEEPQPKQNNLYQSLSVEQLINKTDGIITGPVYPGFVAITDKGLPNPIVIEIQTQRTEVNALNAFYAIEWILFAGFAIFLWWRLVQDERLGLRAER